MTTLQFFVFLLLSLVIFSPYCTAQVISDLLQRFPFSHLAVPQRLAVFWRLENDSISYAIVGKFLSNNPNGIGWVATGWNPSGPNMVGATAVMGRHIVPSVFEITQKNLTQQSPSGVVNSALQDITNTTGNWTAPYLIIYFTRSLNTYPPLTPSVPIGCVFAMREQDATIDYHGPLRNAAVITLGNPSTTTPVYVCDSTNCVNGTCTDEITCTCNLGWRGPNCTIPDPVPLPSETPSEFINSTTTDSSTTMIGPLPLYAFILIVAGGFVIVAGVVVVVVVVVVVKKKKKNQQVTTNNTTSNSNEVKKRAGRETMEWNVAVGVNVAEYEPPAPNLPRIALTSHIDPTKATPANTQSNTRYPPPPPPNEEW